MKEKEKEEWVNCEAEAVMTNAQTEELHRQIAAYATISEQLIDMYNKCAAVVRDHSFSSVSEMLTGTPNCGGPPANSGTHKIPARKRWTPLPKQVEALQGIFDKRRGIPNRKEIKEIATQLSQHGPISEANVSNWFQNRRARMRRYHMDKSNENSEPRTGTSKMSYNLCQTPRMDQWMIQNAHFSNRGVGSGVGNYYHSNHSMNFPGIASENLLQQNCLTGSVSAQCSGTELCAI